MQNRNFLLLILCVFGWANHLTAQNAPQDKAKPQDKIQKSQTFEVKAKTVPVDYLLYLPKGYDAQADKKWPMILFLHGAGERGTNVWRVNFHGPSKYILDNPGFPFILVTPLCPANEIWSNEVLLKLLDEVLAKHKADSARVYLTGLSMGGYGTWNLGTSYPERFAAMAPICGGGQRIQIILAAKGFAPPEKLAALRTLAVWAFHGAKDTLVPPSESEHMLEALKSASVEEIHYTVYPEKQHDSWTETYNNPELYEWFLKHRREPVSAAKK